MKIAVEGCAHGELEKIYETIENIEKQESCKIDLLICCGDFQATRNLGDLQTMAVPPKYRDMCSFYKYYSGEKVAPILTIFIGGNHEASNYLQELPYGGWVAPKIYYMGYAGVVKVNGIRIGGISGIYKSRDFFRGHHEYSPYDDFTRRSVYHVRNLEVFRLKQLTGDIDIFLSHDWPQGIYNYGNYEQLTRFKPYFKDEIQNNNLGSPPCEDLLKCLKPSFWFAAHLHCKFAALVPHENSEKSTKFLALDKCLPKRRFLQILEFESEYTDDGEIRFEYDLEWLTILFQTNHLISTRNAPGYMPGPNGSGRHNFSPTDEEKIEIQEKFSYDLRIPDNFCRTVEPFNENEIVTNPQQPLSILNPQTTKFCDKLLIDDPLSLAMMLSGHDLSYSSTFDETDTDTSENIESEESLNLSYIETSPVKRTSLNSTLPPPKLTKIDNSEEIYLDEDPIIIEIPEENESLKTTQETSVDSTTSDESSVNSSKKKLIRRNQEIYANNDHDV